MAACGSIQHMFENPSSPDNPKSYSSWNQIKPIEQASFTEIFGELHFKEKSNSSSYSSSFHMPSFIDSQLTNRCSSYNNLQLACLTLASLYRLNFNDNMINSSSQTNFISVLHLLASMAISFIQFNNNKTLSLEAFSSTQKTQYNHKKSENFSSMNHESLQLCTEGLGFESSDDVEDMINGHQEQQEEKAMRTTKKSKAENLSGELKRSRTSKAAFPPPISCIGESGKPWVCFKSYREDGRFVLKEMRIPTPEFFHACREDGRLKLQFVQPNSEIIEEEEEEEEEEEDIDDEGHSFIED
ncbi:protein FANTASTIC FOUR 3-like [Tripterygium wilfordii]|uniref:protein FANTASTIC FOUR 3-like n=1 Tax=Tripterygium wilfordii TaxID=458696 RepID=UPI0018F804BC|nr:protein FANTASTIC FOUR 3-like [Tripterygium wilfordii]